MNKTNIEWVKNPDGSQGYTLNSKTGCRNHTLEGLCLGGLFPCYAHSVANSRLKQRYLANKNVAPKYAQDVLFRTYEVPTNIGIIDPFYPRWWPERLEQIRSRKKPSGIFLDNMSDWMGDYWPVECTGQELQVMRDCPQHRFYTLTKQAQNLPKWSPFPDNCWVGVTATNTDMLTKAFWHLAGIEAAVKFISLEPLLSWTPYQDVKEEFIKRFQEYINSLIIGACTGTLPEMVSLCDRYPFGDLIVMKYGNKFTAQPRIESLEEIVRAADRAGIPVFLKDNLKPLFSSPKDVEVHPEFGKPKYQIPAWAYGKPGTAHTLRQEMPK